MGPIDEVAGDVPAGREVIDGELPKNAAQEELSRAFVSLIAAAARCMVHDWHPDYDGVDCTLVSTADYLVYRGARFDMQLKCTTRQSLLKADHLAWSMEAAPFRKLTEGKRFIPAVLGVLLVPEDHTTWLDVDEQRLITESRMYWQYASQLGTILDGQGSITVHLPRSNLFTVEALLGIMQTIGEGGNP